MKKNLILPEEFIIKMQELPRSELEVLEILEVLEVLKNKFRSGELTRREWYLRSGIGRNGAWRNWKLVIEPNLVLAQNYLDFGNKKQKHRLDSYQRFLLYFVEILLIVNRTYDEARIFLLEEKNYQQITRRKFVDWIESRDNA